MIILILGPRLFLLIVLGLYLGLGLGLEKEQATNHGVGG